MGVNFNRTGHRVLHVCDRAGSENGTRFIKYNPEVSGGLLFRATQFISLFLQTHLFRPDIVYVHQLNNWNWVRLSRALPKAVRVYDAHTSVLLEHTMFGSTEEGLAVTRERERNALTEPDHVITVSKETESFFTSTFALDAKRISVVKNATNITPLTSVPDSTNAERFVCCSVLPQDGFQSNKMALDMLLDIASEMERVDPSIIFEVVGGGKKPEPKSRNVQYLGFVDDFKGAIVRADLCLVTYPEEAVCGGVRNKVCDFMALGKPILSTPEGMRGFDDCNQEEEFVLANTAKEFVKSVIDLKQNAAKRKLIAVNALRASHNYQWSVRAGEVLATFEHLLNRNEQ